MKLLKVAVLLLVVFIIYFDVVMPAQAWSIKKAFNKAKNYLSNNKKKIACRAVGFAVQQAVPGGSAQKRVREKALKKLGRKFAKKVAEWSVEKITYELCMRYGAKIKDYLL